METVACVPWKLVDEREDEEKKKVCWATRRLWV